MTSGVAHNDWLIGYMDHNDYDSHGEASSMWRHLPNTESLMIYVQLSMNKKIVYIFFIRCISSVTPGLPTVPLL